VCGQTRKLWTKFLDEESQWQQVGGCCLPAGAWVLPAAGRAAQEPRRPGRPSPAGTAGVGRCRASLQESAQLPPPEPLEYLPAFHGTAAQMRIRERRDVMAREGNGEPNRQVVAGVKVSDVL